MSSDRTPADDAPWVDAGGQRLRCGDLVAYLNPDPAMRYFGRIRALIHDDGAPYVVLQGHPLVDGNDDVPCSMVALVDELALAAAGFRVVPEPDDDTRAEVERWIRDTRTADGPTGGQDDRMADLLAAAYLSGDEEGRPATCPTCDSRAPQYAQTGSECDPLAGGAPDRWHEWVIR